MSAARPVGLTLHTILRVAIAVIWRRRDEPIRHVMRPFGSPGVLGGMNRAPASGKLRRLRFVGAGPAAAVNNPPGAPLRGSPRQKHGQ